MKVRSLILQNFALVREIKVSFDKDVTYLCGVNGSGKTMVGLNAIWFILKGLAQKGEGLIAERFRFVGPHGRSAKGEMEVFDEDLDVTHTITRKLTKDKTELAIKSSDGKERGEEFLASLFSAILINPAGFSQMSGREQAQALGIDTTEFDDRRRSLVTDRLVVGREVKHLKEAAEGTVGAEKVEPVSLADLLDQKTQIEEYNALVDEKITAKQELFDHYSGLAAELESLEREQLRCKQEFNAAKKAYGDMETLALDPPDLAGIKEINQKIAGAEETNQGARDYQKSLDDKKVFEQTNVRYQEIKTAIAQVDDDKAQYLASQELPFKNITIEDGEFRLNGKPFKAPYFSTGECLKLGAKIAAKIAEKQGRQLDYVWIPSSQDLDEENRKALFEDLVKMGFQVVCEYVSATKRDEDFSILLHEMEVMGDEAEARTGEELE